MLSRSRATRPCPGEADRGAVATAMLVLMIITILGLALLARSQSWLRATVEASASDRALIASERGVAEALARIDAGLRADFSGGGPVADGTFRYQATMVAADRFEVEATATIGKRQRTIIATIGGTETVDAELLFVDRRAVLRGPSVTVEGRVGTNGVLDVGDGAVLGNVSLFGGAADCGGCVDPARVGSARDLPTVPDLGRRSRRCPRNGVFTGIVNGNRGIPRRCDQSTIEFTGTIRVLNGPLIIQIADGTAVSFTGADVNPRGDASEIQIYVDGERGALELSDSSIQGTLQAPRRTAIASNTSIVGSLVIGELDVQTGSAFRLRGQPLPTPEVVRWSVLTWSEAPSS